MVKLENLITLKNLENAKDCLVPYIFTENYHRILKKKLEKRKLSRNEAYYYSHFIKKKIEGMAELFEISPMVNGIIIDNLFIALCWFSNAPPQVM